MKKLLASHNVGYKIGLLGGAIGLITAIVYTVYSTSVGHFDPVVLGLMVLGVCGSAFAALSDKKSAPLVPDILFSLSFGMYINDRVIMFEEMINKIYGMNERGAILEVVLAILVLQFVSILLCMIACFTSDRK